MRIKKTWFQIKIQKRKKFRFQYEKLEEPLRIETRI